jgi:hypothetical protein
LSDNNFLNIDAKLRKDSNLAGFEVVSVTRQQVNGYNYVITYKNQQGATILYNIYVTFKGDITVNGATTTQQPQQAIPVNRPNQEEVTTTISTTTPISGGF